MGADRGPTDSVAGKPVDDDPQAVDAGNEARSGQQPAPGLRAVVPPNEDHN